MPRKTTGYRNIDLIWPEGQWGRVKEAARIKGLEVHRFIFGATMKRVEEVEKGLARAGGGTGGSAPVPVDP